MLHSLAVGEFDNTAFSAIAHTEEGTIMALAHNQFPCLGVQFHRESIGTDCDPQLIKNRAETSY